MLRARRRARRPGHPLADKAHVTTPGRPLSRPDAPGMSTAVATAPALPACFRCGGKGEVPIRPHGLHMCTECYLEEIRSTVDTGAAVTA